MANQPANQNVELRVLSSQIIKSVHMREAKLAKVSKFNSKLFLVPFINKWKWIINSVSKCSRLEHLSVEIWSKLVILWRFRSKNYVNYLSGHETDPYPYAKNWLHIPEQIYLFQLYNSSDAKFKQIKN